MINKKIKSYNKDKIKLERRENLVMIIYITKINNITIKCCYKILYNLLMMKTTAKSNN